MKTPDNRYVESRLPKVTGTLRIMVDGGMMERGANEMEVTMRNTSDQSPPIHQSSGAGHYG